VIGINRFNRRPDVKPESPLQKILLISLIPDCPAGSGAPPYPSPAGTTQISPPLQRWESIVRKRKSRRDDPCPRLFEQSDSM